MAGSMRVLSVCSYNQTRSVMTAALLSEHLVERRVAARLLSAGTRAGVGSRATERAARLLAERGIDVSGHRSRPVDEVLVSHADLIVCAEHEHVVQIAGINPGSFTKTFTLPEIVRLGGAVGVRQGRPLDEWLALVGADRTDPIDYLGMSADGVGEIADPTGSTPRTWTDTFAELDGLTDRLAELLA